MIDTSEVKPKDMFNKVIKIGDIIVYAYKSKGNAGNVVRMKVGKVVNVKWRYADDRIPEGFTLTAKGIIDDPDAPNGLSFSTNPSQIVYTDRVVRLTLDDLDKRHRELLQSTDKYGKSLGQSSTGTNIVVETYR